jgi:hypothetical protein
MIEIYNRDPGDPFYKSDVVEITDPIEICIGQLKMLLLTIKGEVLGDPSFGLSLEELVFSMDLSQKTLTDEIDRSIRNYVPMFNQLGGYFNVEFYAGTARDIVYLNFYIPSYGGQSPLVSLKVT